MFISNCLLALLNHTFNNFYRLGKSDIFIHMKGTSKWKSLGNTGTTASIRFAWKEAASSLARQFLQDEVLFIGLPDVS
jgi:hypothetical protein